MAKQTFTAGQVLTAAQQNALQTNDYNWTSTAKTANYTLVAADAGTTIICDSATPFTITFPASVFTTNDTFTIYNQGAGVVTVAPGVGATLQKSGNTATTSATLRQFAGATIRCQGTTGSAAAWQPIYHTYVDGCETGTIAGGVISAPTNYTVTFATGRFNVAPTVTASTYGGQKAIITFTNDPQTTTTGFTVTVEPFSGSTITRVAWVAVQQGTN
jgi:hypothetical protein